MPIPTFKDYVNFMKKRGNISEVMIISIEDGALWASSSPDSFFLQEYKAQVAQEDGTEKEETINEAQNILQFMKGAKPSQGLRICGKKQQVTRNFIDEKAEVQVIYGKIPQGGCCIAHGGKCILIATFDEKQGHSSPDCNETIAYMAMYLAKSDWPTGNEGDNLSIYGGSSVSWAEHVDKALIARGNISDAMLVSVADEKILAASSPDMQLSTYEAEIAQEDGSDKLETVDEMKNLMQGLRINKVKYPIVRTYDDETSKCYTLLAKKGTVGCVISNGGKVIVCAFFDEKKGHASPKCNEFVGDLAKYLKEAL